MFKDNENEYITKVGVFDFILVVYELLCRPVLVAYRFKNFLFPLDWSYNEIT